MSTRTDYCWTRFTLVLMESVALLLVSTSCERGSPPAQSARPSLNPPNEVTATSTDVQTDKGPEPPRRSFDLTAKVGGAFDQSQFELEFGAALENPISPPNAETKVSNHSFRGRVGDPLRLITVTVKNNVIAALELALDTTRPGGRKLKAELVEGYGHKRQHSVTMLNQKLEERTELFDELERRSTRARALIQESGPGARIIFFDPSLTTVEHVLPSIQRIPPDLLKKARSIVDEQMKLRNELQK